MEARIPPDQGRAADLWDRMIGADGHAWLRRLIAAAGTEGVGSYAGRAPWVTESSPLPGDELTALVEAVDDVRASMLRWMAGVRPDRQPGPATPGPPARGRLHVGLRRHVQRGPQPDRLAVGGRARRDLARGTADRGPAHRPAVAGGRGAGGRTRSSRTPSAAGAGPRRSLGPDQALTGTTRATCMPSATEPVMVPSCLTPPSSPNTLSDSSDSRVMLLTLCS